MGLERQARGKLAGLRTHALVALGASSFAIVGVSAELDGDQTRVAAQVVSGIGFIGAGAILRDGGSVTGLTTAATLWVAAAVGLLAGVDRPILAAATSLLALLTSSVLGRLGRLLVRTPIVELEVSYEVGHGTLGELLADLGNRSDVLQRFEMDGGGSLRTVSLRLRNLSGAEIERILADLAARPEVASARTVGHR